MRKDYVMGNSAIAAGALCSGVKIVAGYPGTPSTEIIESIFMHHMTVYTLNGL